MSIPVTVESLVAQINAGVNVRPMLRSLDRETYIRLYAQVAWYDLSCFTNYLAFFDPP